jgi:hypothetical protein
VSGADTTTAATTGSAPPARWFPQPSSKRDLVVVYTASVQGYVEPCGCTAEPLGGLARLGAVIDEARRAHGGRVLFVDGGDLLFEKAEDNGAADRCQAEARTTLLVSSYARFGLAATTRGPLDDVRGAPFRDALLARFGVTSVEHGRGVVVDRGGVRALVIGVDVETPAAIVQSTVDAHAPGTDDPVDVVVVLAQLPHSAAKAAARAWRGVDLVVVGRAAEGPVAPEKAGDAVVVSAGWQAQNAGVVLVDVDGRVPGAPLPLDDRAATAAARRKILDVRLAELDKQLRVMPEGAQKDFQTKRRDGFAAERAALDGADAAPFAAPFVGPHVEVRALPLRRGEPEEPTAARELQAYVKSIPTLVQGCERDVVCPEPAEGVARYVGAETCRGCHADAWDHWQQALVTLPSTNSDGSRTERRVGHARAWTTLVDAGRERDRSCVGCHSAGFDEPGGACTTTLLVQRGLQGVQCESCHGPGSLHVAGGGDRTKIRGVVDEATCRGCHVPPHIERPESFVFEDGLRVILGAGHGAARARTLPPARATTP